MKTRLELADIIRPDLDKYLADKTLTVNQRNTLLSVCRCRTAELGGHIDRCDTCGHIKVSYNSCRNANCPKCGGIKRIRWLVERTRELPPLKYFHMVFTVPDILNSLFLRFPKPMYSLLFQSAWKAVQTFAAEHRYLGAETGMIAVLHTWGQNLTLHPHVHCIIPAGGITVQNQWRDAKKADKGYLFPVKAVTKVFRGIFTDGLIRLNDMKEVRMKNPIDPKNKGLHALYRHEWVVFSKAPLPGQTPEKLVSYLSHYVNRVAISNDRIRAVSDDSVRFAYKDYRDGKPKQMSLPKAVFVKRFLLHVLPKGFRKVRYYGLLSSRKKTKALFCVNFCIGNNYDPKKTPTDWQSIYRIYYKKEPMVCPKCKKGKLKQQIAFKPIRGDPEAFINTLKSGIKL
jgi:hypothetical protein